MTHRSVVPLVLVQVLSAGLLLAPPAHAQQTQPAPDSGDASAKKPAKAAPPEPVTIHIEVSAGDSSKPVESASVYVRFSETHKFKSDKLIEMNVKTTPEGKARVPLVPKGKILIQVIAPGWKTFGKWFDLTDDEQVFKIHLDRPPKWY
jgi:hypothetical protein